MICANFGFGALARVAPLFQLDLALDLVHEIDAGDGHRRARRKRLVALELAVRKCLAHRLFDLALGADPERLEKFSNTGVEDVLVHGLHPSCETRKLET